MSRAFFAMLFLAGLALSPMRGATDAEVDARRNVLNLAGAFTNDGFKIRDGNFTGTVKDREANLVQVNLYAGNQYWFSVATADASTKVSVAVYDESGHPVKSDSYTGANSAAAGISPEVSGPYYVQVRGAMPEAEKSATFCLIYSYK